ncbi:MAG: hypothetical protein SNJ58_12920 [Aggregatilineales bacterium]
MNTPSLEVVFEYLARLISERTPDSPFTLSLLQPALQRKFPNFSLRAYGLESWRDFLRAAEQAGYFKLISTGDPKTSCLVLSSKRPHTSDIARATAEMQAADPRHQRWMTETLELLLLAERADQILQSIAAVQALAPPFEDFLAKEERLAPLYYVRGKIRRLRQFLKALRDHGEAHAIALWKPARSLMRFPNVPAIKEAPRIAQNLSAVFQGEARLDQLPLAMLDNLFFGVIGFLKDRLSRERAWDWLAGLEILEEEARALPRPAPLAQRKGLFGTKPTSPLVEPLDEVQIQAYTKLLLKEAGARITQDDTPRWRAYVETESLDAALRYLAEQVDLMRDDALLTWLDDEIGRAVEANNVEAVRNLANKSAILMVAREHGAEAARGRAAEMRTLYESILKAAQTLSRVFAYLKTSTPAQALAFLQAAPNFLEDEAVGALLEEQLIKAARAADVSRYRRVRQRTDLWRKVADLGVEQGSTQHARVLAAEGDDRAMLTEMGLLLLPLANSSEEMRELVERFPSVATPEGMALITQTLEALSFRQAPPEQYQRHYNVQRLIARCLEIGIDRALLELR